MFEFIFGFALGVWVGSTYDCKPVMEFIVVTAKNTAKGLERKRMKEE